MICFWIVGCGYAIIMFGISFSKIALQKWLYTFFGSFGFDVIIMFNLKMFLKVLIAVLLMSMARFPIMLTVAGAIAGKIIDVLMAFVFPS